MLLIHSMSLKPRNPELHETAPLFAFRFSGTQSCNTTQPTHALIEVKRHESHEAKIRVGHNLLRNFAAVWKAACGRRALRKDSKALSGWRGSLKAAGPDALSWQFRGSLWLSGLCRRGERLKEPSRYAAQCPPMAAKPKRAFSGPPGACTFFS